MIDVQQLPFRFRSPIGLRWIVLGWLGAEVLVFVALVHGIGLGNTILLGLATTVLGFLTMRRVGLGAAGNLRRAAAGLTPGDGTLLDGMLQALGAVLLIVPGFLANLAGLSLLAPSVRGWAMRRFGAARVAPGAGPQPRPSRPDVIDLSPEDWRIVEPR